MTPITSASFSFRKKASKMPVTKSWQPFEANRWLCGILQYGASMKCQTCG